MPAAPPPRCWSSACQHPHRLAAPLGPPTSTSGPSPPPPTARLRGHLPTSCTALCCPGRWCCCPAGPGPLLGNPPAVAASASTALDSVPSPGVDPFLDLLWALAAPPSPMPSSGHEALSPGHFPSPTPRQAQLSPHSPSCAPPKADRVVTLLRPHPPQNRSRTPRAVRGPRGLGPSSPRTLGQPVSGCGPPWAACHLLNFVSPEPCTPAPLHPVPSLQPGRGGVGGAADLDLPVSSFKSLFLEFSLPPAYLDSIFTSLAGWEYRDSEQPTAKQGVAVRSALPAPHLPYSEAPVASLPLLDPQQPCPA